MDNRPLLDPSVPAVPPVDSAGKEGTAPPMKSAANEEATGTAPPMKSVANEEATDTAPPMESAAAEMAPGTALPPSAEMMNRIRGFFSSVAGRSSPPQGCDSSSTAAGGSSTGTNDCVIHIWSRGRAGKKGDADATIKNGDGGATSNTWKEKDPTIKNGDGGATSNTWKEKDPTIKNGDGAATSKKLETGPRDSRREEFAALLERLVQFSESLRQGSSFADPAERLLEAVQLLANAVNSKSRALAASEVEAAAAALSWAATHGKVQVEAARTAKRLSSDAMSVATKSGRRDPSKTEAYLFCISIPGSLALLPYLPERIPGHLQFYVAVLFGIVFAAASGGVVLSLQGIDGRDVEIARWLSVVSFAAFSLLVTTFISCALASGSVVMMIVLAALVVVGQFVAWRR